MRVLKFGGTSLANPERFSQAAKLIEQAHLAEQAAGVLSAPAKITNHLVALSEKATLNQPVDTHLNESLEIFYNIINGLYAENNQFDLDGTKALIEAEFTQIKGLLEAIRQAGKVEDAVKATIDCCGEKLSIAIMKAWFEARGYNVHIIDPVKQLLARGSYLESSVEITESTKRVNAASIEKDKVVLMAGFTAGNEKANWCFWDVMVLIILQPV
ncbi:bifunctional aspartokinase/homoserine dehydrogenase [Rodentibacter pneumotropicus]|uniref:Bifunctional aspartokinase/homoserine dehydrogenase n=1 Tax=Rodentibacter pneumotropicus TaxID=758 RepID=A0A448MSI0_9PAST|nr:bifunctional aspartokinase/homoserine dehydrogenase [Rodentibacter pneumotropicus]